MSIRPSLISQLQLVVIPSRDQDRSVDFYEALGWRNDVPFGDGYRCGRASRRASRRASS